MQAAWNKMGGNVWLRWLLVAALVLSSVAAGAQSRVLADRAAKPGARQPTVAGSWTRVGLAGEVVRWLAWAVGNRNVVYAAADGTGVFQSADGGRTWSPMPLAGLDNLNVQTVAVCGGVLFAGTWGGGVYRFGGSGWTPVNNGLGQRYVVALACDSAANLYAGTEREGVFKSANGGSSWSAANSGLTNRRTVTLRWGSGAMMLGTRAGVFRSTDQGASWSPVGLAADAVFDFAFDPRDANRMWAATTTRGVLSTNNGGATWTSVAEAEGLQAYSVALDAQGILWAGTRNAGIYHYEAGTWVRHSLDPDRVYMVRYNGAGGGRLLAATADGIWMYQVPPTPTPTSTPTFTPSPTSTATPTPGVNTLLRSNPIGLVNPGDIITYVVDHWKVGGGVASTVVITNAIPLNTELVAGSIQPAAVGSFDGRIVTWRLGDLGPDMAAGSVSYQVRVPTATPTDVPTPTPTNTPTPTAEPTATDTPTPGLRAAGAPASRVAPMGWQPALRTASGSILVINRGAFVYWTFDGRVYHRRTGSVVNGQLFYLPLIVERE